MKKRSLLIIICFICVLLFSTYLLIFYKFYNQKSRISNLEKFRSVDKVPATGWVMVQGTNIDMPILNYYTTDVSDPTYNIGWRLNGSNKQDSRIIVYSHNMKNVSSHPLITDKTHARFEQLMSFIYTSFIKKNKYIQYTTDGQDHLYKIYAVSLMKQDKFDSLEGNLSKEYIQKYSKNRKKDSYFKMDVDINGQDKLLTLVTCTRFFGSTNSYSFVVDAREVRKNEKVKNYAVSETVKYKKIKKILEGNENDE